MRRRGAWLAAALALPAAWATVTLGAGAGAFAASGATASNPTASSPTSSRATVTDSAEAWYQTEGSSSCTSPVGCGLASPPSPYPADTLHVGTLAGQETARSYLLADLSSLSPGVTVDSAELTVPLDTNPADGSLDPASAQIRACLVTSPFTDGVQGAATAAPTVDCSLTRPAVVDATRLSVDLEPFVRAWALGRPVDGIALMAVPVAGATWHVVFDDHLRRGGHPATTALIYHQGGQTPSPSVPPPAAGDIGNPASPPPPAPVAALALPAPSSPAAVTATPLAEATTPVASRPPPLPRPVTRVVATFQGFRYPAAMLLPLVFVVGTAWMSRLLLSDATPYRKRPA